jgi:hypothetical protein
MDLFHDCAEDDFDSILAEMEKEMSMGDIMKELGYGCTVNASQCIEILSLFLPLTEITLSKILGTIARTQAGLEDNQNMLSTFNLALGCSTLSDLQSLNSWNIDVLIDAIKQLVSLFFVLFATFFLKKIVMIASLYMCPLYLSMYAEYRLLIPIGYELLKIWTMRGSAFLIRRHSRFL